MEKQGEIKAQEYRRSKGEPPTRLKNEMFFIDFLACWGFLCCTCICFIYIKLPAPFVALIGAPIRGRNNPATSQQVQAPSAYIATHSLSYISLTRLLRLALEKPASTREKSQNSAYFLFSNQPWDRVVSPIFIRLGQNSKRNQKPGRYGLKMRTLL